MLFLWIIKYNEPKKMIVIILLNLLQISDRGPVTDMEEEVTTMNGSESVLNSSFNSAFSGFESLLRKQMGDDSESNLRNNQTHPGKNTEGFHQKHNGEVRHNDRSRSPTFQGDYVRTDSGYHGTESEKLKQCDTGYKHTNGDIEKKENYLRNGSDIAHSNGRAELNEGNDWSKFDKERYSHPSSLADDRRFDKYHSEIAMDNGHQDTDQLAYPLQNTTDRNEDRGRARSVDRIKVNQSFFQNYGPRNQSSDSVSDRYYEQRSRRDLPPRGRSASPFRYNRYSDSRQEDNPYREMDPMFRNRSPDRSNEARDRNSKPQRESGIYSDREYQSLPSGFPSSAGDTHREREPREHIASQRGSNHDTAKSYSQPQMRQPLVTPRTAPLSSGRPPVNRALFLANGNVENGHREVKTLTITECTKHSIYLDFS